MKQTPFFHTVSTHNFKVRPNLMYTASTQNSNGFIMKNQDLIPADLGNETS